MNFVPWSNSSMNCGGYGFITADELEEDVFVHSRALNDCGFHSLMLGQRLLVKVDDSGRGPQVQAVRLLQEQVTSCISGYPLQLWLNK